MRGVTRSLFVSVVVVALAGVVGPVGRAEQPKSAVPSKPDNRTIVHVLNRLGFGPAPSDIERVRDIGLQSYIDQQLHPERIADAEMASRLAGFQTLTKTTREMAEQYYMPAQMARQIQQRQRAAQAAANGTATPKPTTPDPATRREMMTPEQTEAMQMERMALTELTQAKILRAAYSDRQLEEVMVDFWFNHFNVFAGKGQVRLYLNEYERDAIRPHVFGKFRDLLQATAESPAMLFYLDNWQSSAAEGARTMDPSMVISGNSPPVAGRPGRRAIMRQQVRPGTPANLPPGAQNRRRGLNENYARELMELHTLGVDGGYTQKDVQEVARAFTGWTILNPRQGGGFRFEPRMHDDGEKIVLGQKIKAGGGQKDGDRVLDILAKHPSTARFIATKLARRFVADEPPAALVDRAAKRFRETDGDIREVVRTIVTSPEFFAADVYRAKVKSPFEFVVSAVRATGIETPNAQPLVQVVRNLGMPLYGCQPPTGYSDKAEAWVNTGALLNRMNFAVQLTTTTRPERGQGRPQRGQGRPQRGRAGSEMFIAGTTSMTTETLIASALAGELSESTAATVAKATNTPQALALVLGSPEFQRR
jgi:uncharacterized protein (DUF1800 family)